MAKLKYDIAPSELCTSRFFVIVQQYMQKLQVLKLNMRKW